MNKGGMEMALIRCPECAKDISDKADFCPNCGYRLSSEENQSEELKSHREEKTRKKTWQYKTTSAFILTIVACVFWGAFYFFGFVALDGISYIAVNPDTETYIYDGRIYTRDLEYPISNKSELEKYRDEGFYIEGYFNTLDDDELRINNIGLFHFMLGGILINIILGIGLYFLKNKYKIQFILSFVYLFLSIAVFIAFILTMFEFLIFIFSGIGFVLFVPYILQIVAAVKYMSGARLHSYAV